MSQLWLFLRGVKEKPDYLTYITTAIAGLIFLAIFLTILILGGKAYEVSGMDNNYGYEETRENR